MMVSQCHSSSSSSSSSSSPSSLKDRIKSSMCGFCCFTADGDDYHEALDFDEKHQRESTRYSPRAWLKSSAHELPEIRDRCRGLLGRIGKCRRSGYVSSDFRYDPMSYALNFEDDRSREEDEEFPFRNFSARLPASPERMLPAKCPVAHREVVACN